MLIDIANTDKSWQDVYRLAITLVTPRPIALVSSLSAGGMPNLAPFSFFNMVSANPPVLIVCPSRQRDGAKKDTLVNIEATGEFVVAVVSMSMAEKMNQASAPYPPDVNEFEAVGFTPADSINVKPSRVAEAPANLECKLDRIVDYGPNQGGGAVVFGRIVAIYVDDGVVAADGLADPDKLQTIGRMGRLTYCRTADRFDLPRPSVNVQS